MKNKFRAYHLTLYKPVLINVESTDYDYFVYIKDNIWINHRGEPTIVEIKPENIKFSRKILKKNYGDTNPDMQEYINWCIDFYKQHEFNKTLSSLVFEENKLVDTE